MRFPIYTVIVLAGCATSPAANVAGAASGAVAEASTSGGESWVQLVLYAGAALFALGFVASIAWMALTQGVSGRAIRSGLFCIGGAAACVVAARFFPVAVWMAVAVVAAAVLSALAMLVWFIIDVRDDKVDSVILNRLYQWIKSHV